MTPEFTVPEVEAPDTAQVDPRLGHLLGRELEAGDDARVVIVGFPSDEGVRRNGGRPGAAEGPREIRRWLYRYTPCAPCPEVFADLAAHTRDLGDLKVSGDVERDQELLGEVVAEHVRRDAFVFILGGGHETAFGHFLGYVGADRPVSVLNWDSDVDVRELKDGLAHSGSPFRQAILHESGCCRSYTVAGVLPYSAATEHIDFVHEHGGRHVWGFELDRGRVDELYSGLEAPALATFDLDAVDQAFAPGVSAPATGGMSAELWLYAAYAAGRTGAVRSCDVVEMNPRLDRDGQTAKLAAYTVWQVMRGLAERWS